MVILGIAIFFIIVFIVYIDHEKSDKELRRCPKCGKIVNSKFNLENKKSGVFMPSENEKKINITIYKCNYCSFSWNLTSERLENNT